ncbi:MAG: HAD-IIB family hydrolase [Spirochaetales bacterium]|nr:HAD-IIB family hydrolase [Spirochaetales bacterium]
MTTLITDIDGTLLGDPAGLGELNRYLLKNRKKFYIVYATGRALDEYLHIKEPEGLIDPDALILNTGSDIYTLKGKNYILDTGWHKLLEPGWEKDRIDDFIRTTGMIIPQNKSHPYKLSYYITDPVPESFEEDLKEQLTRIGLKAHLLSSMGYYLDILPEKCNKGEAARYHIKNRKIDPDNVIVAGDSENDRELFLFFKKSILVANAQERLISLLYGKKYFKTGTSHAAGVLEGIRHYLQNGN